jgi:TetR/AcrR family transcriptional regulator
MDTRSEILACALELFAARGYEGTGVQEVVNAAGVTKPTLYHYFGSKQGLLEALMISHEASQTSTIEPARDYRGDLPLTLRKIAAASFRFARENRTFSRFLLALFFAPAESEGHVAASSFFQRQFVAIREMFAHATREHGNMKGRHLLSAASFLGMINNCIGLYLNGSLLLDDELVERCVHQFEHGIYS